jgi:hypothetical protein
MTNLNWLLSSFRSAVSKSALTCNQDHDVVKRPTWEALQVDGTQKIEELDSVFRELGEVLVDHLEGAFKHILHDERHLILHERLELC